MYSKKLLKHFFHPKNMGKIKSPDAKATVGNPVCGDILNLYIKVKDNIIKDIKFETLGCAAAIAVSSVITEMAKGRTLEKALKINPQKIAKELGGLPSIKMHCASLGTEALRKAIEKYQKKISNI